MTSTWNSSMRVPSKTVRPTPFIPGRTVQGQDLGRGAAGAGGPSAAQGRAAAISDDGSAPQAMRRTSGGAASLRRTSPIADVMIRRRLRREREERRTVADTSDRASGRDATGGSACPRACSPGCCPAPATSTCGARGKGLAFLGAIRALFVLGRGLDARLAAATWASTTRWPAAQPGPDGDRACRTSSRASLGFEAGQVTSLTHEYGNTFTEVGGPAQHPGDPRRLRHGAWGARRDRQSHLLACSSSRRSSPLVFAMLHARGPSARAPLRR